MNDKLKEINKLVNEMMGAEPMIEYREPVPDVDREQFYALGEMYKNRGYRSYLENALNKATKNTATNSIDEVSLAYNKSRMILLKELLLVARNAFNDRVKLDKKKETLLKI